MDSRLSSRMESRLEGDIEDFYDCLESDTTSRIRHQSYNEGFHSRTTSESILTHDTEITRSKSMNDVKPSCDEYMEFSKEWKKAKFVLGDDYGSECTDCSEAPERINGNHDVGFEDVSDAHDDEEHCVNDNVDHTVDHTENIKGRLYEMMDNNYFRVGTIIVAIGGIIYLHIVRHK